MVVLNTGIYRLNRWRYLDVSVKFDCLLFRGGSIVGRSTAFGGGRKEGEFRNGKPSAAVQQLFAPVSTTVLSRCLVRVITILWVQRSRTCLWRIARLLLDRFVVNKNDTSFCVYCARFLSPLTSQEPCPSLSGKCPTSPSANWRRSAYTVWNAKRRPPPDRRPPVNGRNGSNRTTRPAYCC